jgi:hypothetical protein
VRQHAATAVSVAVIAGALVSVLLVPPRPLPQQPFSDALEAADGARQLVTGHGYVTFAHGAKPEPPRYPPGYSLLLAPFAAAGEFPANVQLGAKIYAAVYLLLAAVAAWTLAGPVAGALAAILIAVSPFVRIEAMLVMSDAIAAGLTLLVFALLTRPTPKRVSWAAVLAGAVVAIRLPMVLNLVAMFVVLPNALRRRMVLCAAPPLAGLALFNWWTFGSPLKTGYDYWLHGTTQFSGAFALKAPMFGDGPWIVADVLGGKLLQAVCPCPLGGPQAAMSNLAYYPSILVGLFWIFAPPLVSLVGLFYAWRHRRETVVRFGLLVIALNLAFFVFYFYQGARFMAAPATLLVVFASAQAGKRYPAGA